jgi:hypothetical protein
MAGGNEEGVERDMATAPGALDLDVLLAEDGSPDDQASEAILPPSVEYGPTPISRCVDGATPVLTSSQVLERVEVDYRRTYQRFVAKEKSFTQQYSHLYTQRLLAMRPALQEAARVRWGCGEGDTEGRQSLTRSCLHPLHALLLRHRRADYLSQGDRAARRRQQGPHRHTV